MQNYKITLVATALSALSKEDLESRLVASLFDFESGNQVTDGQNDDFVVIDYDLTEALPL